MAVSVTSAGQWPGVAHGSGGQLALTGGQYYCPLPAETLVQAGGAGQVTDQLLYATGGPGQNASYQTVDLSDSGHHLVAAGQTAEVISLSAFLPPMDDDQTPLVVTVASVRSSVLPSVSTLTFEPSDP